MKIRILNSKVVSICALFALLTLTACDDSTSATPSSNPVAEVSSSSDSLGSYSSAIPGSSGNSLSSSSLTSASSENNSSSSRDDVGLYSSSSATTVRSSSSSNAKSSSSKVWTCSEEGKIVEKRNKTTNIWEIYQCTNGVYEVVVYSSSSEKVYTFKELFKEDSVFNKNMEYGTFVDSRDGQEYKTIVIKTGYVSVPEFEVFAQNLNYGMQVKLGTTVFDDNKVEKFCYDDDSWYCEHYFGGLYSWSEAMGLPKACDSVWTGTTPDCPDSVAAGLKSVYHWDYLQIQGICPEGWHVMNENEWRAMIGANESAYWTTSKASNGSNGNGFSALFGGGGFYDDDGCRFDHIQESGLYWLPKERTDIAAGYARLETNRYDYSGFHKNYGHSVRCVKNYLSKSR